MVALQVASAEGLGQSPVLQLGSKGFKQQGVGMNNLSESPTKQAWPLARTASDHDELEDLKLKYSRLVNAMVQIRSTFRQAQVAAKEQDEKLDILQQYCVKLEESNRALQAQVQQLTPKTRHLSFCSTSSAPMYMARPTEPIQEFSSYGNVYQQNFIKGEQGSVLYPASCDSLEGVSQEGLEVDNEFEQEDVEEEEEEEEEEYTRQYEDLEATPVINL